MDPHLQHSIDILQKQTHLSEEERAALIAALKELGKRIEITEFKLGRTEKVKRTTAILLEETIQELELKRKAIEEQNRELELESSLERVRTVAMSMTKREDMLDVCRIISDQLQQLNIKEIRNVQTAIINDEKGTYLNYEYFTQYKTTSVLDIVTKLHPTVEEFAKEIRKSADAFFTTSFEGKALEDWRAYRGKTNQNADPILDKATSLHYYFYSIGPGALGISTYNLLKEEEIEIFKRFRNVFDLAYRRFIDIEQAEEQAREAKIEAALERTRTQTMLMQHSNELDITSRVFHEQLLLLGIDTEFSYVWLPDVQKVKHSFWAAWNEEIKGSVILKSKSAIYDLDRNEPYTAECFKAWESGEATHLYTVPPEGVKLFFDAWSELVGDAKKLKAEFFPVAFYYAEAFIRYGCFGIMMRRMPTADEIEILRRISIEFERAYTRFLDLQKAEAQAKESQIEAALERIRSRAMAMHKTDELLDAAELVSKELSALGIVSMNVSYAFVDDKEKNASYYSLNPVDGKIAPFPFIFPHTETDVMRSILSSWKKLDPFSVIELDEKATLKHQTWVGEHIQKQVTESKFDMPFSVEAFLAISPKTAVIYTFNFSKGYLFVIGEERMNPSQEDILLKFTKVFDNTYRRFLDLKQAEAQAREAQVQLAMERVRARTMAMQKSDELAETSHLLFEQFKSLGDIADQISIGIINEAASTADLSVTVHGNRLMQIEISLEEPIVMQKIFTAWKANEKSIVIDISGKQLKEYNTYRNKLRHETLFSVDIGPDDHWIVHAANFSKGILSFSSTKPQPPETLQLLERFAAVFDLTYTRFLDLKNAEAQAREAQIELGLERVRARAMAMQNSDELAELVTTVFKELTHLDFALTSCIIWINKPELSTDELWLTSSEMNQPARPVNFQPFHHSFFHSIIHAWKAKDPKWIYELIGEERKSFQTAFFKEVPDLPETLKKALTTPERIIFSASFSSFGALEIVGTESLSDEQFEILHRFGGVFNSSYTRFNDLKQAEAQARKAQIETALERVRSRTMGMQKSEELKEVIQVVYDQFVYLNIYVDHTGFVMDYKARDDYNIWIADNIGAPSQVTIPYFDCVYYNLFNEAKKKGWDFFATNLTFEEKNQFYNELFKHVPGLPEESKKFLLSCPGLAASTVLLENVGLYIENFGGIPYTDEENNTLMRFGKVFQQTYTRFNDLQKAEAQAREAQIEVSLERVRSKAMAMHASNDLENAVAIVFEELDKLKLGMSRCGIGIMDKEKRTGEVWTTTVSAHGATLQVSGDESMDIHPLLQGDFDAWLDQRDFSYTLKDQDLVDYYKAIGYTNFNLPESQTFSTDYEVKEQYYYATPFGPGALFAFRESPFPDEAKTVMKRFADVFKLTYTRYNDLKQAEAQAREAKIELSLERVRARTMAMHSSDELVDTTIVLFEELKTLGVSAIRTGVAIIDNENEKMELWSFQLLEQKTNKVLGVVPMKLHPFFENLLEAWRKKDESFFYEMTGEEVKQFYKIASTVLSYPEQKTFNKREVFSPFFFPEGSLTVVSHDRLTEEERNIMRRFASVFGLLYRRFLDLQKAENNAREATIEAALERVRGKTMAMHRSGDLNESVAIVFDQLERLNLGVMRCGIGIMKGEKRTADVWVTSAAGDGNSVQISGDESFDIHPLLQGAFAAWQKQEDFSYVLEGKDMVDYYRAINHSNFRLPESQIVFNEQSPRQFYHVCMFENGGLFAFKQTEFPEETKTVMKRLANVFNLTYKRFLDIQRAETQAREAKIEAALERVRARALAMQEPEELKEVAQVLRVEMGLLGVEELETCSIYINDEVTKKTECWYALKDLWSEEKKLVSDHFPLSLNDTWVGKEMNKFYQSGAKKVSIIMKGANRKEWIKYCEEKSVPFRGYYGEEIPDRTYHLYKFSHGAIGAASAGDISEESWKLLRRASSVFSLAYSRFKDLTQARTDLLRLKEEKKRAEDALSELQVTQAQLIQAEKMASLGELTAGIAHEIQNPLNFVNNFSEVSNELLEEMKIELEKGDTDEAKAIANDVKQNLEKILHHGKRADAIVKGMLQHSRTSSGQMEPTDLNGLADEYLRLAYHGLRAKDKSFNASFKTDFDTSIGMISIIPQDMGRVILNLITNAFYVVNEKRKQNPVGYEPTVIISTKMINGKVEIAVNDNGNGIPPKILDKIFQPFFTTKPTGEGTGLGLSLSYDIVKAHGGEIKVKSTENVGTAFTIDLPLNHKGHSG